MTAERTPVAGWIAEALGPLLERAEREAEAAEEHARTCTDRPCRRCRRYVCACGAAVDDSDTCRDCSARAERESLLAPTRDSIPSRFRWACEVELATLQPRVQASPDLVRRGLVNPPSTSLLFLGRTGAGKTSLATAMLDSWVRADPRARTGAMFLETSWLARARARYRLGDGEAPLVSQAIATPLLLLDDLGNEREDRDGCITDVVYERHNAERPTWITSGLVGSSDPIVQLAEKLTRRYDGGFVRRVLETGKRVVLG